MTTFPAELLALRQFVLWRAETRDGRVTKVPYQVNGKRASTTDPATWTDFETAALAFTYSHRRWSGISFVFSADDPYCGIDLDHVIDPATGEIDEQALAIIETLNSYTEYSPSGTGVHIYVRATLPADARHKLGGVEVYDRARAFTVTGRQFGTTPDTLAGWDGAELGRLLFPNVIPATPAITLRPVHLPAPPPLSDREVYDLAAGAANGGKFRDLWNGGWGGHGSQSEADLALCVILAFWTNRDADQMQRLFLQSGLMRDKWEKRRGAAKYGERTVFKACELARDVFIPAERSA